MSPAQPWLRKICFKARFAQWAIAAFLLCSIPDCCPLTPRCILTKTTAAKQSVSEWLLPKKANPGSTAVSSRPPPGFCDAAFPPAPGGFPIRAISHTTNISQRSSLRPKPSGDGVQCVSTTLTALHGADSLILAAQHPQLLLQPLSLPAPSAVLPHALLLRSIQRKL